MKIFYKALFLCVLCLAFASCAQDETTEAVASEGSVRLAFRVVDGVQTRVTEEDGWTDWNENLIDRLDLFLFSGDNLYKHIEKTGLGVDASSYQDLESELTYTEVANGNYTYYMVANCESLAGFNGTLTELKGKVTPDLVCNEKQSSFVMDDRIDKEDKDYQDHLIVDESNKTATLQFDLSRAAAKIRVSVLNADETQSIIDDCSFRLCNYVESGTSVLAEGETYGTDKRKSMDNDMPFTAVPVYNDNQVVFYSYPNDWFDESKLVGGSDGAWTITDFVKEDPILSERQTYILLRAPFNDVDYYYKVPINKTIYDYNDKATFTNDELEEIYDIYRMKRNSIYDITVTIDREGGPISSPVTPTFYVRINDWNKGGDYNIGAGEFE